MACAFVTGMHPPLVRWRRVTPSQWRAISCHLRVGRAGWGEGPAFTHAPLACLITHKPGYRKNTQRPVYVPTITCATLYTKLALPGNGSFSAKLSPEKPTTEYLGWTGNIIHLLQFWHLTFFDWNVPVRISTNVKLEQFQNLQKWKARNLCLKISFQFQNTDRLQETNTCWFYLHLIKLVNIFLSN